MGIYGEKRLLFCVCQKRSFCCMRTLNYTAQNKLELLFGDEFESKSLFRWKC